MELDTQTAAAMLYQQNRAAGLNLIASIVVLRKTYGLSLSQAKEIACWAENGLSLEQHQAALVPALLTALATLEDNGEAL